MRGPRAEANKYACRAVCTSCLASICCLLLESTQSCCRNPPNPTFLHHHNTQSALRRLLCTFCATQQVIHAETLACGSQHESHPKHEVWTQCNVTVAVHQAAEKLCRLCCLRAHIHDWDRQVEAAVLHSTCAEHAASAVRCSGPVPAADMTQGPPPALLQLQSATHYISSCSQLSWLVAAHAIMHTMLLTPAHNFCIKSAGCRHTSVGPTQSKAGHHNLMMQP
jgi:hypothetical protein